MKKGIISRKSPLSQRIAFADSTFAGNEQDWRLRSGGVVLNDGVFSWFSMTQHYETLKPTESAYIIAFIEITREDTFLRQVLDLIPSGRDAAL